MESSSYGLHLTMRIGNITNYKMANQEQHINNYLCSLVVKIGMTILAGPLVKKEIGPLSNEGCSGVVILVESHAAIHTYPFLREVFLDVFSCKLFKIETVLSVTKEFFGDFDTIEEKCADRGLHWGDKVKHELQKWEKLK